MPFAVPTGDTVEATTVIGGLRRPVDKRVKQRIIQRRRDLAVMRALGASAPEIFGAVIIEAFWVTVLGIASGWVLGNVVSWGLGLYMTQRFGMNIAAFGLSSEEIQA